MITSASLDFLTDLNTHNERVWFEANKKRYEVAKKEISASVTTLIAGLAAHDPQLAGVEAKDSVFRIFRDVRFSHNKAPYKNNMGAWIARGGRKSIFAGYYLHVQPGGNSFLAGGCYMPDAPVLKAIREGIDYEPEELRAIIADSSFQKLFGALDGEQLRSAPKGYAKDHPAADLLKYKSFTVLHKLSDAEVVAPGFAAEAIETFVAMMPLTDFLNRAIGEVQG
jgi:uncharacterized protein (TIGR02453 family)